jgi:hypothetical protein
LKLATGIMSPSNAAILWLSSNLSKVKYRLLMPLAYNDNAAKSEVDFAALLIYILLIDALYQIFVSELA